MSWLATLTAWGPFEVWNNGKLITKVWNLRCSKLNWPGWKVTLLLGSVLEQQGRIASTLRRVKRAKDQSQPRVTWTEGASSSSSSAFYWNASQSPLLYTEVQMLLHPWQKFVGSNNVFISFSAPRCTDLSLSQHHPEVFSIICRRMCDRVLVQVYMLFYWNRLVFSQNFVFAAHSSLLVTVIPDSIMLAISACGSVFPDMDWGCRRYFWVIWRKLTLGGLCRLKHCGCACPV